MVTDNISGPSIVGPSLITKRKKPGVEKKKWVNVKGNLVLDFTDTPSDLDIRSRNLAIISTLQNASEVVEATNAWKVGALLSLFEETSRNAAE